jgi:peptidyl-tRNA hydrolase
VLGTISPQQRSLIDPAVIRATDAIVTWIEKGIESAMSLFNADV